MACAAAAADLDLAGIGSRARSLKLHESRAWLALLHYRGGTSQADGRAFFLAPTGRSDAAAELDADLTAFAAGPAQGEEQHAQCRFPARYAWLKRELAARFTDMPCPRFDEWRKAIDAEALSLVFADAYLNNPSSMYGHTFLRLHRSGAREGEDLLDYTINFAATPDTENGLLYAVKGLAGAFPGLYSTMPYYMKIQEYNNVESRDLWEYRLAWDREKIDGLLRHAWEMGSTHFDYYFFSENCSYQLLTLLEAVDPELRLSAPFGFGTIPTDTLRAVLEQPGLVTSARYRPSHLTQMKLRRERLGKAELALATRLGRGEDPAGIPSLGALASARQALVLDSAHDYHSYLVGFGPDLPAEVRRTERRLLVRRGALGLPSTEPTGAPRPAPPEAGHATLRAGAGAGSSSLGPFAELHWRAALHDLTDDAAGYVPDHQLAMADARLRVDGRSKEVYFESFDLVKLTSLSPADPWVRRPSWTAATGVDQARERGCAGWDCAYYYARGGGGVAAATNFLRRETWYALLMADLGLAPVFEDGWRVGGGPVLGLRAELGPWWRLLLEAGEFRYQRGPARSFVRLNQAVPIPGGLDLRLTLERRVPVNEASAALLYYF